MGNRPGSNPTLNDRDGCVMMNPGFLRSGSINWRWCGLTLLVLVPALNLVLYRVFFSGPAVIAPPAPDLSGVDPAIREAVEEARAEVKQTPRSAEAWGRLG